MKRFFDIIFSALGLLLFAIPLLLLFFKLRQQQGSPVFFIQERSGLHGNPFRMFKFRSMTNERDSNGMFMPYEIRITPFGRWLRNTSLDELPELWNVLKGEMSLVGPRPLLLEYLHLYSPKQARRHDVRPGITGWAQIHGRNTLSWGEKFDLDVWYVENQSLLLDLKILLITVKKVLMREGVNASEQEPMPPFLGTNKDEK